MSYCIMARCVGLNELSFFLRWINSIFHGGISEWLLLLLLLAALDVEAISTSMFVCFFLLNFHFDSLVQIVRRFHWFWLNDFFIGRYYWMVFLLLLLFFVSILLRNCSKCQFITTATCNIFFFSLSHLWHTFQINEIFFFVSKWMMISSRCDRFKHKTLTVTID